MKNLIRWWECFKTLNTFTAFLIIVAFGVVLFNPLSAKAQAVGSDPNGYRIVSYDFDPNTNISYASIILDIFHQDNVSIYDEYESSLGINAPRSVRDVYGTLYYIRSGGQRRHEYDLKDWKRYISPPYTWNKPGQYEIDIYGLTHVSTSSQYLATMKFTVALKDKPPPPTCTLTFSPNTIDPQKGEVTLMEWTGTNATRASIDHGIGNVGIKGSKVISPDVTTTYTATFVGIGGTVDCSATIKVEVPPLHEKAAALARKLVNNAEGYLWGGKGWDLNLKEFTTPERILSGYAYYNPDTKRKDTGVGLDCSGLVTWAFNRSHDTKAGFDNNYIKYVNADGMFLDHQSDPITKSQLRPGDTLSFDWDKDGHMDHVAMYVGESGGYDVVNAASPILGIEEQINDTYSKIPGFVGFRRIHQADTSLTITTGSPVDLVVTDPEGNTLSSTDIIPSDEEYIREIPGELYYLELMEGHDGRPQDMIISPTTKNGTYLIKVVPEEDADTTATYSLKVEIDGVETVMVENETIDTIPDDGFALVLTAGEIEKFGQATKVLLEQLHTTIGDLDLSSEPRQRHLLSTVESALNWLDRNRKDQVARKLTKLQRDIKIHVAKEITSEELADINRQIDDLLLLLQL